MAAVLAEWFGNWSEDPFAARVFNYAVSKLLVLRGARQDTPAEPPQPKAGSMAAELFEGKPSVSKVTAALVALALADYDVEKGSR